MPRSLPYAVWTSERLIHVGCFPKVAHGFPLTFHGFPSICRGFPEVRGAN